MKKNTWIYVIVCILSALLGSFISFGAVYMYPNLVVDIVNKTEKVVNVNEEGISSGVDAVVDSVVVVENYPDLKANQNYIALQDELAGTENRIAKARSNYNEKATEYNVAIRKFPKSIIASMFGFEKVELFKADESANNVPQVTF